VSPVSKSVSPGTEVPIPGEQTPQNQSAPQPTSTEVSGELGTVTSLGTSADLPLAGELAVRVIQATGRRELSPSALRQRLWREVAEQFPRIEIRQGTLLVQPVIRGTRVFVAALVSCAADGYSLDEIVHQFDASITIEDVQEALLFSAALTSQDA
jgi:uncharacterized protein (DUF433 family)